MDNKEKYRQLVPESDYKECKGCHAGKKKCTVVHYLYNCCPCSSCLVKTSCTDYCTEYLYAIRYAIVRMRKSGINVRLKDISHKGFAAIFKHNGQKLIMTDTLYRWMDMQDINRINSNLEGIL